MRKLIRPFVYGIPTMNAWDREDLLDNIEKMYQIKRRDIIIQTGIITCTVIMVAALIVGHLVK